MTAAYSAYKSKNLAFTHCFRCLSTVQQKIPKVFEVYAFHLLKTKFSLKNIYIDI